MAKAGGRREIRSHVRQNAREVNKLVLIVCEGSKTEPEYFRSIIRDLRISSANVYITGDCGSSPLNVVDFAIEKRDQAFKEQAISYDKVFCVFDKDQHQHYVNAINKANGQLPPKVFECIQSVPCFEYWILLHFEDTTQSFNVPVGKQLTSKIKKHCAAYRKNDCDVYAITKHNLELALQRSKRIYTDAQATRRDNPSTRMHQIIQYLHDMVK